ncbi:hypothetical protein ACEP3U_22040 [Pseudomonas aeruginosa]
MAQIQFFKVATLPGTLQPDSFYFVENGNYSESYLTNSAGQLPGAATGSSWFEGVITRQAGRIELTLRLPLAPDASDAARFPAPIEVLEGDVELPR